MAKRITISIPDELHEQIQVTKNDYGKPLNTSQICQDALTEAVREAEAHKVYKDAGYEDGLESYASLSRKNVERIAYTLNGDDPKYQDCSLFEVVNNLEGRMWGEDRSFFHPRLSDLGEGIVILHPWLKYGVLEDKRAEVCWSYIEGWYLAIKDSFFRKQGA